MGQHMRQSSSVACNSDSEILEALSTLITRRCSSDPNNYFWYLLFVTWYCFNITTKTSVIKHALVPNGWVGGWLGDVVVGGGGGGGRGAKAEVHSTFWVVGGVGGVGWVVVVVVVGGRRQRCIVPSGR